ncbi:MAG: GDP-mannose 4,6-dehydratase [Planctomycetes bacterium]|nr:GDP-mannose 4,6-dehydratase [Planctomycetota bacterium]MBI5965721.1 GDP-mannose 4,6-dehydratase [Chloroflexota bacterium]
MTNSKCVIVLGSSGFIGSHLVSWLRSYGYYVVGIDMVDRVDSTIILIKPDIFYQLVLPDQHFEDILKEIKPDVVINASGPASVANSLLDPTADFTGSVNLCFFVLEALRKILPECRFLLLSSAAVYGNPSYLPVEETASSNPISPYGYHKMMCEILVREYFNIYGIRTSTVRIFSAYGPGLRKQILWDIYLKVIKNKQVELFGTGKETRDFIFVQDVAYAIQLILEQGAFDAEIYNVANGCEVSIEELGRLFLSSLKVGNWKLAFSSVTKPGDPKRWCADIGKIKSLGYSPQVGLENGILQYVKWAQALKESK